MASYVKIIFLYFILLGHSVIFSSCYFNLLSKCGIGLIIDHRSPHQVARSKVGDEQEHKLEIKD